MEMETKKMFLIVLVKNHALKLNQVTEAVTTTPLETEELEVKRKNKQKQKIWQLFQEDNKLEQIQQM